MRFGLHLKNKKVITAEQLVAALEVQMRSLVKIGQLALEEGMLTPRDIFEILLAQSHSPSERFGEIAVEMGLLTRENVPRLLMLQADRKRSISEILVGQGALTDEQLAEEMAGYRKSMLPAGRTPSAKLVTASRPRRTKKFVPIVNVN